MNSDNREGHREFSRIEGYVEYTITGCSNPFSKNHFRISRQSFEVRQENIRNDMF